MADPTQGAGAPLDLGPMLAPSADNPLDLGPMLQTQPVTTSAPGEIGTAALRGVLAGMPTSIGKGLQSVGADQVGGALRSFGEGMAQQPWLQARPEGHGGVVNALAGAAEGLGSFAGPIALGFVNPFLGAAATGAQMAGEGAQSTLEKGQANGTPPEQTHEAAAASALGNFVWGALGGAVVGKGMGALTGPVGRMIGMEGAPMAEGIIDQLAGTQPLLKTYARALLPTAAEGMGVMLGQAGTQAAIEQNYGIDDTGPLQAMKDQIGPSLALTGLLSGVGLANRAIGAKLARDRTSVLADGNAAPEARTKLADQYAATIAQADPAKAAQFAANAKAAIETGQSMTVDSKLFDPNVIEGLPRTAAGQGDMFGGTPEASPFPRPAQPAQGDMFGTPPDLTPQSEPIVEPGQGDLFTPATPAEPTGTQQDIRFPTPEADAAALAEAQQSINPGEGLSTQELINRNTGVNTPVPDVRTRDARALDADAAFANVGEPTGVVGGGASAAETPQAPQRAPNAPKTADDITGDVKTATDGADGRTTSAVQRRVDSIKGMADAPTHQDQINLLDAYIKDKGVKGDVGRALDSLLQKWRDDMPKEPASETQAAEGQQSEGNAAADTAQDTAGGGRTTVSINGQTLAQRSDFGKTTGAVVGAGGHYLDARVNQQAAKAVAAGDFPGVVSALANSKNVIVQHIAKLASKLKGVTIGIDNDKVEQGPSYVRQGNDMARLHVAQLDAAREALTKVPADAQGFSLTHLKAALDTPLDLGKASSDEFAPMFDKSKTLGDTLPMEARMSIGGFRKWAAQHEADTTQLGEDRLREVAGQTPTMHTRVAGFYDHQTGAITTGDWGAKDEKVLTHELTHALTVQAIDSPTEAQKPYVAGLQKLYEHVKGLMQGAERPPYGLQSVHEFVAEGMANPDFQHLLHSIKYENTSMWGKFTQHVANLLGISREHGTAFTELLSLHEGLHGQEARRAAREFEKNNVSSPDATRGQPAAAARQTEDLTGVHGGLEGPQAGVEQPAGAKQIVEEERLDNTKSPDRQRADGVLSRLQSVLAQFRDRVEGGEQLSAKETERRQIAQDHYDRLKDFFHELQQRGGLKNITDTWWNDINSNVSTLEHPFRGNKAPDFLNRLGDPEYEASVAAQIERSNSLQDTLTHLAQSDTQPAWARSLADQLSKLGLKTTIHPAWIPNKPGEARPTLGRFSPTMDKIEINNGSASAVTVLHEAVHAALFNMIEAVKRIGKPANQREAAMKRAAMELESIRQKAADTTWGKGPYGLTNLQEFVAEVKANPEFQAFLKTAKADGSRSLWSKMLDAGRRLLGMRVDQTTALDRAMSLTDELMGARRDMNEFNASPEGAAAVADRNISSLAKLADTWGERPELGINLHALSEGAFKQLLGWKTVDFIAHGMDVLKVMRDSGFSHAVNAYRAARDARRIVSEAISNEMGNYIDRAKKALRASGDGRAYQQKMMEIGGESSIFGFDYRKSFADNNKPVDQGGGGRALDPAMKSRVDEVHRQYTQLKQAQPNLAKLLVEGEQHNRKSLTMTTATVARNLMSALTGQVPRLEAELSRLPADDANRARAEGLLQSARTEADFVNRHMGGLDFMAKDLQAARNGATDTHLDGASYELSRRMGEAFKAAREQLPKDSILRRNLATLESQYVVQSKNPYFSLGRDGNFFVNIKFNGNPTPQVRQAMLNALKGTNKVIGDLDGQTHAFFRFETSDQAEGVFRKLIAAGNGAIDVKGSAKGPLADYDMKSAAGVTDALRQLEQSLHENVDKDSALNDAQRLQMKQTLTRQLLSMLPETSARSAKMERRGIPGYDGDFVSNFAKRASGSVQDLSNVYTARQFGASMKGMTDSISTLNKGASIKDATRAQLVADEINRRYSNSMKPMDNSAVNLINSLGHSFYLAASPAFYIRTMAQPYHRGVPFVGSRYGMVNTAKEMAGATGVAMKIIGNSIRQGYKEGGFRGVLDTGLRLDGIDLNPQEKAFVQELHDRGILKLGLAQQLQHAVEGTSQLKQDVARMASMTAQYAEMTNRLVVGLAAFRLAERGVKTFKQAGREANTEYAIKAINWTMDNFDQDNTARAIGKHGVLGSVTPLATAFMNYDLQTMQQIVRTVHDGLFHDQSDAGKQRASEARKEFAGLIGTTAMVAGLRGLPFVAAFAGVYNWLTKDQDQPGDIRDSVNTFLTKTMGTGFGNTLAHGLPYAFNMDSSTFGLANLLPGSEFLADRRVAKDALETQAQQLLGPALNAGIDVYLGYHKMLEGNVVKGIESMLPAGLKSYYKAAELGGAIGPGGYTDAKGNPLPENVINPPNGWDILRQGLGFRSARKADVDEARYSVSVNEQLLTHRRQLINDQIYKAFRPGGDVDARPAAMDALHQFNRENPTMPIRNVSSSMREHMKANAIGAATGLGFPVNNARMVPWLMPQVGYAAMPRGQ